MSTLVMLAFKSVHETWTEIEMIVATSKALVTGFCYKNYNMSADPLTMLFLTVALQQDGTRERAGLQPATRSRKH